MPTHGRAYVGCKGQYRSQKCPKHMGVQYKPVESFSLFHNAVYIISTFKRSVTQSSTSLTMIISPQVQLRLADPPTLHSTAGSVVKMRQCNCVWPLCGRRTRDTNYTADPCMAAAGRPSSDLLHIALGAYSNLDSPQRQSLKLLTSLVKIWMYAISAADR